MSRPRYLNSKPIEGHPIVEDLPPLPKKKRRPKIEPSTRQSVYERDDFSCRFCGCRCTEDDITIDHVIALSQGGTNTKANMVTACSPCNSDKGDKKVRPLPPRHVRRKTR